MKETSKISSIRPRDEEWDDTELPERGPCDEVLILKRQPPPRKEQLMAHGAKDVRCVCCMQVRPIAGAAEVEEGWICEECLSAVALEPRFGGQRGR